MKYFTVCLCDGNTGEVIYQTNTCTVNSPSYLRTKLQKNVDSLCNYLRMSPDRDVVCQIIIREQRGSLDIPFPDVY